MTEIRVRGKETRIAELSVERRRKRDLMVAEQIAEHDCRSAVEPAQSVLIPGSVSNLGLRDVVGFEANTISVILEARCIGESKIRIRNKSGDACRRGVAH